MSSNRPLRIGVIDLVTKGPTRALWARVMNANFAAIMPQVVALWCEEEGHSVTSVCYTGFENLIDELPEDVDIVFIGAFTESAQTAYALSARFRMRGAITVLGGPHARCYPQDSQRYFDYVTGFTDRAVIREILDDRSPHRPLGRYIAATQQPAALPGVRERWKYIEQNLRKAPFIKMVPMLGSLGCPYTCSFCIDSVVPYQPLDFDVMKDDLRFLRTKFKRPLVGWHDPNFGIRFNDYMDAIEDAIPADSIDFIAESSLSLLTEPHMQRLRSNGFKGMLPGIESWYTMGEKSRTGANTGMEKVRQVSDQVNMIMRYVPYVQTNFVLGMDTDAGREPFELTKRFLDLTPGAFPAYSMLSSFGQAAPLNLDYQRSNRVLPFPFHFLDNNRAMNVRPLHYAWPELYENIIDLSRHSFSAKAITNRFAASRGTIPRWLNVVRAMSSEGYGRIRYNTRVLDLLRTDTGFREYFEQESESLPAFYTDAMRKNMGSLWEWLPEGAIDHDPHAYLRSLDDANVNIEPIGVPVEINR
jgi:hypothetical protein